MRYLGDFCVSQGVFGVGLLNDVSQILPQPTLVAMATKFGSKLAITQVREGQMDGPVMQLLRMAA